LKQKGEGYYFVTTPDGFDYTGAYIKINRDGSVALVSAGGDEEIAK